MAMGNFYKLYTGSLYLTIDQKVVQTNIQTMCILCMCVSVCHRFYLLSCFCPGALQNVVDLCGKLCQLIAHSHRLIES